jgi:hypothetical protein
MWGYAGTDSLTAGSGGAKMIGGAGDDTLTGGAGVDTFYLESSATGNGADTFKAFTPGASGDVLAFPSSYVTGGLEGKAGTAFSGGITAFASNSNNGVTIGNKVVLYDAGNGNIANVDTPTEIAAILNTASNNDIQIAASAHGVVMAGSANSTTVYVYYVDNDSTATVTAAEVTLVGTMTLASGNIGSFDTANFNFYT